MHRTLAPASSDQCRGRQGEFCSTFVPMRPKKRGAQETLHARNSPPTHQIRDVAAPSRFATHALQSVHRKRADPMCPSTQPTAGAKSPCERLTTAHRRDFTSHTPRSGVSLHVLHAAQRRVSESSGGKQLHSDAAQTAHDPSRPKAEVAGLDLAFLQFRGAQVHRPKAGAVCGPSSHRCGGGHRQPSLHSAPFRSSEPSPCRCQRSADKA